MLSSVNRLQNDIQGIATGFTSFNIALLVLVLILGDVGMGARRWLVVGPIRLQPSELMKISVVLALARWFTRNNPDKRLV